ncbi:unnamed protein product [Adineta steineri]|uniref:LisH domain-containing protein n=1 Tax=Adineta steineri TaxID=433720 RepID=A0A813MXW6_9BILA|nr:unnamed protein product [Adineta steineri]CAF3825617.1 unnamed protein product [Adineta steineri]
MAEANLNYQTIKTTHAAREADDQRTENRKKNLIILILHWLADEGYIESAKQLEHETNLDVNKFDVCDNVDLTTILQEYESYFHVKYNRYPKITKKNGPSTAAFMSKISAKMTSAPASNRRAHVPPLPRVTSNGTENFASSSSRLPSAGEALHRLPTTGKSNQPNIERINAHVPPPVGVQRQSSTQQPGTNSLEDMNISFMKVSSVKSAPPSSEQQKKKSGLNDTLRAHPADNTDPSDRLLKPLGGYTGYTSEWRELAEVISRTT